MFDVPLSEDKKELCKFQKHLKTFTGLDERATCWRPSH